MDTMNVFLLVIVGLVLLQIVVLFFGIKNIKKSVSVTPSDVSDSFQILSSPTVPISK